jgi:NAD+ synthase
MNLVKKLQIDPTAIQQKITHFIRDYIAKAKAEGVILGISGGVDSATTVALSVTALGRARVLGLYMPERETASEQDKKHVEFLARKFKFKLITVDLTDILGAFYRDLKDYDEEDKLSRGNLKARTRMLILYYYANHQNRIVLGSSDKSETMMGYFTKWGDGASDISPIMDLYKTQVRQLALHIGVPPSIVEKPSTPGLWPDQTAEEEIGLKYEILDQILYSLEHFVPAKRIASQLHLPNRTIINIKKRWLQTEHKRQIPLTTKLAYRTIGADFRLNRQ